MAKCYLMLEDRPVDGEDDQFEMHWAVHWDTEDGLQPEGDDLMSEAQFALTLVVAALENAVATSGQALPEPSRILIPH